MSAADSGRAIGVAKGLVAKETDYSTVPVPAGLGWSATYPINPRIINGASQRRGDSGLNISALLPTADVTYYVDKDGGGLDTNDGLTHATAVQSINKAVALFNASAFTCADIRVYAGVSPYRRANNFSNGTIFPTKPVRFVAVGGIVTSTMHDNLTWAFDGTNTACSKAARSNVARVFDPTRIDSNGLYVELTQVSTAAICNVTPNSWAQVSTDLYVHTFDGSLATNTTIRAYLLDENFCLTSTTPVSCFLDVLTDKDGWALEGGSVGPFKAVFTALPASPIVIGAKNASFRYSGSVAALSDCVTIDSLNGLAYFENCDWSGSTKDGLNVHNAQVGATASQAYILAVNCTGTDFGRGASQSNNAYTMHENAIGIDICGRYEKARGGTFHNINNTKCLAAGTRCSDSIGDLVNGGVRTATEFLAGDNSLMWCFATEARPRGAADLAYYAETAGQIYQRDIWHGPGHSGATGIGLIGTW